MNGAVNYGRIFRGRGIARVGCEDAPAVGAAPGGVAEAVTSATQGGTRVRAILSLPKRVPVGGKVPGFAIVNGHGGNTGSGYAYCTGLARGGTQDGFFEDLRGRVAKVRGTADGVFEFGFTEAGGHLPDWLTKPAVRWLEPRRFSSSRSLSGVRFFRHVARAVAPASSSGSTANHRHPARCTSWPIFYAGAILTSAALLVCAGLTAFWSGG